MANRGAPPTNRWAVAYLVMGIGWVASFPLGFLLASAVDLDRGPRCREQSLRLGRDRRPDPPVAAIRRGRVALRELREAADRQRGRGMAIAGRVLGWMGVAFNLGAVTFITWIFRGYPGEGG